MELRVARMTGIQVFPYFGSLSLEVFPCVEASEGQHASGGLQGMAYEALELRNARLMGELNIGATYIGIGKNEAGEHIQTHWMYCTQVTPHPTFGISRNHRIPGVYGPAPFLGTSLFVTQEPLRNIVGLNGATPTNLGVAEFRLGDSGDLVATAFGVPHTVGIRIDRPFLPPHFLTGANNLVITGESVRTGQTVVLQRLTCLRASAPALFVQEDPL
ncbi:hypothetical protein NBRC116594_25330 [Shimia sp. NS0008-38b]|uniref:hypothetical protein n=1 Tax=Shimia sp. NS0008-38b TaxID=3127653 RepID=UPI0031093E98